MDFSYKEMFLLGWPILSLLLLCSMVSLAVILERALHFRKRRVDVRQFFSKIEHVLSSKDPAQSAVALGEPMSSIARTAIAHSGSARESIDLAVDRAIRLQVADLENFVPILGTIAGATPFVGLLGTVIGIIRAFKSLSVSGGGGPQVVAGGIAEALVATAFGLIVAIPALVAYNYFSTRIRRMTENMEICADGLIEILTRSRR